MKILYSLMKLHQAFVGVFKRQPSPTEFLQNLSCEFQRRGFAVEEYQDFKVMGIRGGYSLVHIDVNIDKDSGGVTGSLFFPESKHYDLISADLRLKEKTRMRSYNISANLEEIARELSIDALILGVAAEVNLKRQKIDKAGEI